MSTTAQRSARHSNGGGHSNKSPIDVAKVRKLGGTMYFDVWLSLQALVGLWDMLVFHDNNVPSTRHMDPACYISGLFLGRVNDRYLDSKRGK